MLRYVGRRLVLMVPTLLVISWICFIIIELPPGDFLTSYIATLETAGTHVDQAEIAALKKRYGLDQPMYMRYLKWVWGILHGDFGVSLTWNRPVEELIGDRLFLTFIISLITLLFIWVVALPLGIYSAVRQYSIGDYLATFISFAGRGIPSFMLAMVTMWLAYSYLGVSIGGLFSPGFSNAPWSLAKFLDLLKHIWIPMVVLGVGGTAGAIRIMRAQLLDELNKPYVTTARSKGLSERTLLWKYPVRVALNPFVSTLGWSLPSLVSGATIISVVLSLPTTGSMLLRALMNQDMYLAGSFLMLLSFLTVIGTLISDILLAWLDPRIRQEE